MKIQKSVVFLPLQLIYFYLNMKTKRQIEHFLKNKKYKSEMDFEGIHLYCKNKYGIRLHVPSNYHPNMEAALDYASFAAWLEHGYGAGDAVKYESYICLVQDSSTESVKICLRIDGNTPNFDSVTLPVQVVQPAEENALKRIYEVLSERGLEFGNPFFTITEKFIPIPCSLVTFQNHKTGQEGCGVIRIVTKTGDVVFYCYLIKGEPVRYSMNEYAGKLDNFSFASFKPTDYPRKLLESALNKVGKTWNHHMKRIEPLNMRVQKGEQYWYITDKMQVTSDVEKETATSNKRYLAGNYFKRQEDAVRILSEEMELRRNLFAEPEKDFKTP